jgi:hypothetical protein
MDAHDKDSHRHKSWPAARFHTDALLRAGNIPSRLLATRPMQRRSERPQAHIIPEENRDEEHPPWINITTRWTGPEVKNQEARSRWGGSPPERFQNRSGSQESCSRIGNLRPSKDILTENLESSINVDVNNTRSEAEGDGSESPGPSPRAEPSFVYDMLLRYTNRCEDSFVRGL